MTRLLMIVVALPVFSAQPSQAQDSVEDFYKNKKINHPADRRRHRRRRLRSLRPIGGASYRQIYSGSSEYRGSERSQRTRRPACRKPVRHHRGKGRNNLRLVRCRNADDSAAQSGNGQLRSAPIRFHRQPEQGSAGAGGLREGCGQDGGRRLPQGGDCGSVFARCRRVGLSANVERPVWARNSGSLPDIHRLAIRRSRSNAARSRPWPGSTGRPLRRSSLKSSPPVNCACSPNMASQSSRSLSMCRFFPMGRTRASIRISEFCMRGRTMAGRWRFLQAFRPTGRGLSTGLCGDRRRSRIPRRRGAHQAGHQPCPGRRTATAHGRYLPDTGGGADPHARTP